MFSKFYHLNWTYSKTRDMIWVGCTFSHQSAEVQFVMFYWLYKTCSGRRPYSSTTDNSLDFYTNKTKQQLQTNILSLIGPWRNVKRCLRFFWAKLKLAIICFLLLGRENSAEILVSVWQEEKNFEVQFWNAAISKYIQLAFSCVMEKLLIFYMYEI